MIADDGIKSDTGKQIDFSKINFGVPIEAQEFINEFNSEFIMVGSVINCI